jgi:predicted DNA-binding protein (MmcQ/YjbR family)
MVSFQLLKHLALSFPETSEEPHFEKTSFRVKGKIFVSFDVVNNKAFVKLSEVDQDVFASSDHNAIYPVDNKWGQQGWTIIEMAKVNKKLFEDIITTAYCTVAPKKLAQQIRPDKFG